MSEPLHSSVCVLLGHVWGPWEPVEGTLRVKTCERCGIRSWRAEEQQ